MKARRGTYTRGLSATALAACVIGLAAGASADEYYSWIDRSGTIVLTDDLSNLPSTHRNTVTIHYFSERSTPAPSLEKPTEPLTPSESPQPSQEKPQPAVEPRAVNSADVDLPLVLLDSPEEGVKWQYAWVPLTMPISHGGNSINGFWAHHQTTSPFATFSEVLQRNGGQQPIMGARVIARHNQRQAGMPSDIRFMRELRALSERMTPPLPIFQAQRSPQKSGSQSSGKR